MFRLFTIKFPFYFFASFRFKFFTSLHFSSFRFEAKQSEAKFKCIFSLFFAFFAFFCFKFFALLWFSNFCFGWKKSILSIFSFHFRFASIFSLNFRLFYLRFRLRFLVFCIEVNHVKSGFFFASKQNEIFASISNFVSKAKVRAHPIRRPACSSLSLTVLSVFIRKGDVLEEAQPFLWPSYLTQLTLFCQLALKDCTERRNTRRDIRKHSSDRWGGMGIEDK